MAYSLKKFIGLSWKEFLSPRDGNHVSSYFKQQSRSFLILHRPHSQPEAVTRHCLNRLNTPSNNENNFGRHFCLQKLGWFNESRPMLYHDRDQCTICAKPPITKPQRSMRRLLREFMETRKQQLSALVLEHTNPHRALCGGPPLLTLFTFPSEVVVFYFSVSFFPNSTLLLFNILQQSFSSDFPRIRQISSDPHPNFCTTTAVSSYSTPFFRSSGPDSR
ncbi:hypothetical protein QBC38DRAFT_95060 [Podospora fimiseda]|uniref:Uncharacterized protein n=1 Tax=Podospora fimiseda TaxID=252190 RepID=A0AAN7BZD5_9PEZI|nr:hypothetical protein QBC38DRAFT_95060 [Podospora fimiseda]